MESYKCEVVNVERDTPTVEDIYNHVLGIKFNLNGGYPLYTGTYAQLKDNCFFFFFFFDSDGC